MNTVYVATCGSISVGLHRLHAEAIVWYRINVVVEKGKQSCGRYGECKWRYKQKVHKLAMGLFFTLTALQSHLHHWVKNPWGNP